MTREELRTLLERATDELPKLIEATNVAGYSYRVWRGRELLDDIRKALES